MTRSLASVVLVVMASAPLTITAEEAPGDGAKQALARGWYPWYDAASDGPARIVPPAPYDPPDLGWLKVDWLGDAAKILLYLLAALVIGGLIVLLIRNFGLWSREKNESVAPTENVIDAIEALPTRVRRVDDFLAEAMRLAEAGDWAGAIVYYYSHQLVALDRVGALHLVRGKTNRQYARETAERLPAATPLLQETITLFESSFFGHEPLSEVDFLSVWNRRDEFAQSLEHRERPA